MSDCICLGSCFGPNGTPDTWAELVAAERALADELAADVERYVGLTGALARWKEAREQ